MSDADNQTAERARELKKARKQGACSGLAFIVSCPRDPIFDWIVDWVRDKLAEIDVRNPQDLEALDLDEHDAKVLRSVFEKAPHAVVASNQIARKAHELGFCSGIALAARHAGFSAKRIRDMLASGIGVRTLQDFKALDLDEYDAKVLRPAFETEEKEVPQDTEPGRPGTPAAGMSSYIRSKNPRPAE